MYKTFISAKELEKNINQPDWVIIDCRFFTKEAHLASGERKQIPQSQFAYLNTDLSSKVITGITSRHPLPSVSDFVEKLQTWGIGNGTQVIVYDDAFGAYAGRLWWMLNWLGHDKVAVLDGGWKTWVENSSIYQTSSSIKSKVYFIPKINNSLLQSAGEVLNNIGDEKKILLDSRSNERHLGINEHFDPIGGHIPKSISYFYENNLNENGKILPKEVLYQQFSDIIKETNIEDITFYCGSGVSANLNIVSMVHAGIGFPKLYVGSWSEWITDESRPMKNKTISKEN